MGYTLMLLEKEKKFEKVFVTPPPPQKKNTKKNPKPKHLHPQITPQSPTNNQKQKIK